MIHKIVRKIALAVGVIKLVGVGMLAGISGAQAAITLPGVVSISTGEEEARFLNPVGGVLRIVDADAMNSDGKTSKIEIRFISEEDGSRIVSLHASGAPNALLNIQSGTLQFSEVPADWYSAHWLVQETDKGTRLINRWKPAFSIGRKENGTVSALSSTSDATLWKITGDSAAVAEVPQADEKVTIQSVAVEESKIALVSDDLNRAVNVQLQLGELDANLAAAEEVETGIYRFMLKLKETFSVIHIQNGALELSMIDANWWSGQWLAESAADAPDRYLLRNRWKPEILLERNAEGALAAVVVDPSGTTGPQHFWRILSLKDIAEKKQAIAVADARDVLERHRAANRMPNILEVAEKNIGVVEKLGSAENVQAAQLQTPHSANGAQLTKKNKVPDAPNPQAATSKKTVDPGAVVAAKAGVEEQKKKRVAEKSTPEKEKKSETILDKIHGEVTGNNNFTDSVGPFQTYLKLYTHDLLGLNETIWVLGDAFAFGKELKAFRAGFDLPVTEEKNWYVRYAGHFSWLNPTPVDDDYQSLAIREQEHIAEFYRVTQTDGHRNETGVFFNYLNSNQAKLELGATEASDLSFSSRDLGAFTSGNLWRENEATKDNGGYRLSVSKGLNVFGATREFAVRTEARNSPLVVKGHLDARRYWKESRWHIAGAADFQWADRPTEWHKHFGLGGANYAPGFPAAEVAGEIGVGAYIEVGRAFDVETSVSFLPETVTLTPYLRGDVAYVNSLFDNLTEPLEYARDGFFASAKLGVRVQAVEWNFDVGYAVPLSGDSRFEDAGDGRLSFTASFRW